MIFNIQRFSLEDGPGIRTTIFFKGCPLHCVWCHNPEGINDGIEIAYYKNNCTNCGECIKVCDKDAHYIMNGNHIFDREKCDLCMKCTEVCKNNALIQFGRELSEEEIIREIIADKIYFDHSGGGVTLSGGEPTLQSDQIKKILQICRKYKIRTAIETCGYFDFQEMNQLLKKIDLVIYDIKMFDSARHKKFTGVSNEVILDNLKSLSKIHKNIWIRIPMIKGINTEAEEIKNIARFVNGLDNITRVELLQYNNLGVSKYEAFNKENKYNPGTLDSEEFSSETFNIYKEYLINKNYLEVA